MPGAATMAAASSSTAVVEPVEPQSLKKLSLKSLKRALDVFASVHSQPVPPDPRSKQIRVNYKVDALYGAVKNVPTKPPEEQGNMVLQDQGASSSKAIAVPALKDGGDSQKGQNAIVVAPQQQKGLNDAGVSSKSAAGNLVPMSGSTDRYQTSAAIIERLPSKWPRPVWHAPWKNYRVISGHLGWVRSIAFDPSNEWFCTGSADRTIKIWSVATGKLKLTLTGHIEQIRGLAVSSRHPYMFSAGDDKQVKCWDLEQNKVIRSYHGHLSGVYCLALHPTLDILLTGGRDSVCRVWDIRTKAQIFALSGHENTVCSVFTQALDPQVVTGSHDTTVKFWDLAAGGKTMLTLTHHKKSVRSIVKNPSDNTFASASADNIKKFMLPRGEFLHNMLSQQKTIINSMAINEDGVMATAGTVTMGACGFGIGKVVIISNNLKQFVQPGSLDSEAGIYALSYDITGSRLVSCEADKTIKMWKEDETATPETHPVNFKPPKEFRRF